MKLNHGRCADCDASITKVDVERMEAINSDHRYWGVDGPYDLGGEEGTGDLHCADCIDHKAEQAQARSDARLYGGDGPVTVAETAAMARRFK